MLLISRQEFNLWSRTTTQPCMICQTLAEGIIISAPKNSRIINLHCSPGVFSGLLLGALCHYFLLSVFSFPPSTCTPHTKICHILVVLTSWILILLHSLAVRNEIPFAYLLQHDQCADTSLLKHGGAVVLQVRKPHFAACSQPSLWIQMVIAYRHHASLFSSHIFIN